MLFLYPVLTLDRVLHLLYIAAKRKQINVISEFNPRAKECSLIKTTYVHASYIDFRNYIYAKCHKS